MHDVAVIDRCQVTLDLTRLFFFFSDYVTDLHEAFARDVLTVSIFADAVFVIVRVGFFESCVFGF